MPLGAIVGTVGGALLTGAATAAGGALISNLVGGGGGPSAGNVSNTQLYEQQTIFGEEQNYQQQLQKLIANPASVSSLPGYQFQMDQGSQAVDRQMRAQFGTGSGAEMAGLAKFGQGLASSFYGQQASLLAQLAGLAPSSPSQLGATGTAAQGQSWQQQFQMMAGLGQLFGQNQGLSFGGSSDFSPADLTQIGAGYNAYIQGGGTPVGGGGGGGVFAGGFQ